MLVSRPQAADTGKLVRYDGYSTYNKIPGADQNYMGKDPRK